MSERTKKKLIDYKWIIAVLCFFMVFICIGFCSTNKGLYLSAITSALDIRRSIFSVSDSIRYIATAIVNLFFGTLVAKHGEKKLILAGIACLIVTEICYVCANSVVGFYLGSLFLGIGLSWTSTTMVGCVINKWCKENKGTIMGAVLAANGVGGALAAQIVTPLINAEGNPFGYRNAYKLIIVILAVLFAVICFFFRNDPPQMTAKSAAPKSAKKRRGESWVGIEYDVARRRSYFYITCICIFLCGMVLQGVTGMAAAHMQDVGLSTTYVATVVSVHSLTLAAAKFLTGFFYDHTGLRTTATFCYGAGAVTMIVLANLSSTPLGMVLAMVYGVVSSLALPLETIMLPLFASDMFGERSYNKVLGIIVSVNTAGYACGSPVINAVFDIWGSYRPMLFIYAGIMVFVAIFFQFALNSCQKEKKAIIAAQK